MSGNIAAYIPSRDFVGYADSPPNPKWPNDARLALNIVINYEEGSEYNQVDKDGRVETRTGESPGGRMPAGKRDMAYESMFEYGSRVGFWRIYRLLKERNMPATMFGCALALERNPAVVRATMDSKFDICCHGWRWEEHFNMIEAQEREHIARAISSIEKLTGERPLGWYCRFGPSDVTRRLLVEHGGFLYDSDAYNDELPYWVRVGGNPHLVIPYTLDTNDSKFNTPAGFATGHDFYDYLTDAFDLLYAEGARHPKMMSVGLHCRVAGRPARAAGFARFLDHVQKHDKVWVCRRIDIAKHWLKYHLPA